MALLGAAPLLLLLITVTGMALLFVCWVQDTLEPGPSITPSMMSQASSDGPLGWVRYSAPEEQVGMGGGVAWRA